MLSGRGGGQVGRGGSSTEPGRSFNPPPAGEKTEADKIRSDADPWELPLLQLRLRGAARLRQAGVTATAVTPHPLPRRPLRRAPARTRRRRWW
jgi:hypothetical protein